jgi:hypothetical protein
MTLLRVRHPAMKPQIRVRFGLSKSPLSIGKAHRITIRATPKS